MGDKQTNFWDYMIAAAQNWKPVYTVVLVLAGLLVGGFITTRDITSWINAAKGMF